MKGDLLGSKMYHFKIISSKSGMFLFSLSASHGSQTIKEHLQHLDAINIILTSLLNMKSRHLRTKNPLSNEVVQGLRKVPEVHNIGLKHTTLERASATNQKL